MNKKRIDEIEYRLVALETTVRFMRDRFGSENENKARTNKICFNEKCPAYRPCGCFQNLAEICKHAIRDI